MTPIPTTMCLAILFGVYFLLAVFSLFCTNYDDFRNAFTCIILGSTGCTFASLASKKIANFVLNIVLLLCVLGIHYTVLNHNPQALAEQKVYNEQYEIKHNSKPNKKVDGVDSSLANMDVVRETAEQVKEINFEDISLLSLGLSNIKGAEIENLSDREKLIRIGEDSIYVYKGSGNKTYSVVQK